MPLKTKNVLITEYVKLLKKAKSQYLVMSDLLFLEEDDHNLDNLEKVFNNNAIKSKGGVARVLSD